MPGEASGDARLPSAGGDFEACLFAQTSFCLARPIRSIGKSIIESSLRSREDENSLLFLVLSMLFFETSRVKRWRG
ncbi:hypothetical protein, partial [Mesotoga sp. Brook.08.105.5.1]|uniref:hypothetical protein n=1 Tax=Mesotoga sp. Brook.08.105.5.1 TaxID=1421002 RepID=UPI000C59099A